MTIFDFSTDLSKREAFRDLSKPIGALTSERLTFFKVNTCEVCTFRNHDCTIILLCGLAGTLPGDVWEEVPLWYSLLCPRLCPVLPSKGR